MAQQAGHDVSRDDALASYVATILPSKRDEAVLIEPGPGRASMLSAETHPDLW